ncbi:MAG: hypothetical protein ABJF10_24660 [Chthoniobacter sp.]|uniref:hypothetical protein n=1 Tax=Chthoniobacter sp. TaxID=2510640 RepID=UPI0032ACC6AA
MKRAFLPLLVATLLLGGIGEARDLKTVSGDVYKNVEVRSKDPTGIQIMHDDGVIFLDFKNLSEADQKDFGYDPALYADGWKQKFEAEKIRRQQAELAAQQANARAKALAAQVQPLPNTDETYRPTNQTGLEVTVDSPGFNYGGYPVGGYVIPGFTTVIPGGRGRNVVPYPYGYTGATWGPVEIRRR